MRYDRSAPTRVHRSAQVEDSIDALVERVLRRRGWRVRVLPYTTYGTVERVRILARVILTPPGTRRRDIEAGRGWRRFVSAPVSGVAVSVIVGGRAHEVVSRRGGYIDTTVPADLDPGWTHVMLSAEGSPPARSDVHVVGPEPGIGVVCDVDDTIMITALPRPLLAFWNTFVRPETHRRPVPGMAGFVRTLVGGPPGTPCGFIAYLSTGAWNVAPALENFLTRQRFSRGPFLLTDWGPTTEGWFRSGREHKRSEIGRLLTDLPQLQWVLVGDDGQHDPELYDAAAAAAPGRVIALAIRQLSTAEQLLTHGTPEPLTDVATTPERARSTVPVFRAPDGHALLAAFNDAGVLGQRHG